MNTELSEESIEYVAKNVTPKLSKITICGFPFQTKYDLVDNWRSYCQQKIEKFENRCSNLNGRLNTYHLGNNFCLSNIEDIEGNINQNDWKIGEILYLLSDVLNDRWFCLEKKCQSEFL